MNITKGLLQAGRNAHNVYKRRLSAEELEMQQAQKARIESEAEKRLEESRKELESRKQSLGERERHCCYLTSNMNKTQDLQKNCSVKQTKN